MVDISLKNPFHQLTHQQTVFNDNPKTVKRGGYDGGDTNAEQMMADVVAYRLTIHGLCNAGSIEEALKLFNEMLCQELKSQPDVVNALCKQSSVSRVSFKLYDGQVL
ncbi:hypothetical protein Q3G72_010081 [Acer saccharum]|nr:hypothetical protein Q3G72_010081 [Acer saccharum]